MKGSIYKSIWFFVFLFIHLLGYAQFYDSGQDPASIKWEQINTSDFQIIFPKEFASEANRLANILEHIYEYGGKTLNHKPKNISVILHNQSLLSNGFVVWAPKRMEFVSTPPQNNSPQDWLEQLAIHEFRHVVQIDKLHTGINKIATILLGEQFLGSSFGQIPRWSYEGDAVVTETSLSLAGRGREPSFEMALRTHFLDSHKKFSYDKAKMGSYKDFVTNQYELGYPMVAYARIKYNAHFWDSVFTFVGRNSYLINPFHFGLKKYGGISNKDLYNQTYKYLHAKWEIQDAKTNLTPYTIINKKEKKYYTNYNNPIPINDSTFFVIKSGIDQLKEFIIINKSGNEKKLLNPGILSASRVSYSNNLLAWSEYIPDIRWENRNYSVIKLFDLNKKKLKTLTHKTRLFSPALSPDNNKVVTIEISKTNQYYLTIINTNDGKIIEKIETPFNQFIQYPIWDKKGNNIYVINLSIDGEGILKYNIINKKWDTILKPSHENIQKIFPSKNLIYFISSYSGIDNIYAIDSVSNQISQIISSRFGISDLFVNNDHIYYSNYSLLGFNAVKSKQNKINWVPITYIKNHSAKLYKPISEQENKVIKSTEISNITHKTKPYKKWGNLINLHSWTPCYFDYSNLGDINSNITPGISLLSQNKLNTAVTLLGYEYNQKYHFIHSKFIYKGWFPILELGYDYGGETYAHLDPQAYWIPVNTPLYSNFTGKISFPINLNRNSFIRKIIPSFEVEYKNTYTYNSQTDSYNSDVIFTEFDLRAYNRKRLSKKDLLPKWGQQININYLTVPFNSGKFGTLFYSNLIQYIPGLLNHHSLKISYGYQHYNPQWPLLRGKMDFPRGILNRVTKELQLLTLDYSCPIIYPDLNIFSIFYIKRIRNVLFFDFAKSKDIFQDQNHNLIWLNNTYKSFGTDLVIDYHLFRIMFPVFSGIRYIKIPNDSQSKLEFIFGINFSLYP